MEIVCKVVTDDWELVIRGNRVAKSCAKLNAVLAKRNQRLPRTHIQFLKPIRLLLVQKPFVSLNYLGVAATSIPFYQPVFFENTQYAFDFHFRGGIQSPRLEHDLTRINEAFYEDESGGIALRGQLNFGNELGWFHLPIGYEKQGETISNTLSFQIWPTKMDMASDLDKIHQTLDSVHPYLKFAFAKSTEQSFQRKKFTAPPFDVLWIAQFQSLVEQFYRGFKQVLQAPHNRLLPETKSLKAHQVKGKISPKLGQKIMTNLKAGKWSQRYDAEQKFLSVDKPENQFFKYVLSYFLARIVQFSQKAKQADKVEYPNLSEHFYLRLQSITRPFQKLQTHSLFKAVSTFTGLQKASLVLQQKTGYAAIFKAWQELKAYLDLLGNGANISTKTVSELYELWCFLEISQILQDDFQFEKAIQAADFVKRSKSFEYQADKLRFDFDKTLVNGEKVHILLRHEKTFGADKKMPNRAGIVAWMSQHRPDIFMEIKFTQCGSKFVFLFDAKYRIDLDNNDMDWVPNDALYQMHRYRDALIYQERSDEGVDWNRSRPVYGAYALYPGYFDQQNQVNPYHQTIDDIDIGAFALLPGRENHWLKNFFSEILSDRTESMKENLQDALHNFYPEQTASSRIKSRKSSKIQQG